MKTRLALLALALGLGAGGPARAEIGDRLLKVGAAAGYVIPAGGAAVTSIVNGVFIAYDEGSPRLWRAGGYLFGGLELAIGAGLFLANPDGTDDTLIATLPLVLGTAAIATSFFAPIPDDIVGVVEIAVSPLPIENATGLTLLGRF